MHEDYSEVSACAQCIEILGFSFLKDEVVVSIEGDHEQSYSLDYTEGSPSEPLFLSKKIVFVGFFVKEWVEGVD